MGKGGEAPPPALVDKQPRKTFSSASAWTWIKYGTASVVLFYAIIFATPQPTTDWEGNVIPRAHKLMGHDAADIESKPPLDGLVIAVTGATSGIGLSFTRKLSSMGAHVIAIGRSSSKLERLAQENEGVSTVLADFGDLDSVAKGADDMLQRFDHVDILVNNAGVIGFAQKERVSKQGYEQVFAVNYLSHFLLTEKLMPLLEKSTQPKTKIIQVSSLYHFGAGISDLRPSKQRDLPASAAPSPIASRPGGAHGFLLFRDIRSYTNSKLAQVLHAEALNRRFAKSEGQPMEVVSICPSWVGTSIAGDGLANLFEFIAFESDDYGLASFFEAMLDDDTNTSAVPKFYSNTAHPELLVQSMNALPEWAYSMLPLRDIVGNIFAGYLLIMQRLIPKVGRRAPSACVGDIEAQEELYEWSRGAVQAWL